MPFRRRYKRRSFRRRPYSRRRTIPRRVRKVERRVRKLNNLIETKYRDINQAPTTGAAQPFTYLSGAPLATFLNGIGEDVIQGARVGEQVFWTSLTFQYHLRPVYSANSSQSDILARIMLVWDKQPTGAASVPALATTSPTTPAVLIYPTTSVAAYETDIMALYNWQWRKRFRVLYDRTHRIVRDPTGATPGYPVANQATSVIKKLKLKIRRTQTYNGTGAALSSVSKGALYLYAYTGNTSTLGGDAVNIFYTMRLKYRDA